MEHIKKAIERAKQERLHLALPSHSPATTGSTGSQATTEAARASEAPVSADPAQVVPVDRRHLQSMRIVAHDPTEGRASHYDMLRTQVLQRMEAGSCRTIAVTSPRLGCGKTVTAINLALSIARQSERTVLLVDLDLRKPQVARYLGLQPTAGIHDVISGNCQLSEAMLLPDLCGQRVSVLASPNPVLNPVEHLVSAAMKSTVAGFNMNRPHQIIIFDLPPMLTSDDFLAFLPQVDCALLVASSGESTVSDITECERLMDPAKFLGCVLNKVTDTETMDEYYS